MTVATRTERSTTPDDAALRAALGHALGQTGASDWTIVSRDAADTASTFPGEIVTSVRADGRRVQIYCKFEDGHRHDRHDRRRGLAYEAEVYSALRDSLRASAPDLLGAHHDAASGDTWLFLEYLEGYVPIHWLEEPAPALIRAARWAGMFHATNERRVAHDCPTGLVRFGAEFYRDWARRGSLAVSRHYSGKTWLREAVGRCQQVADLLLGEPQTVIHGDLGYDNVLSGPYGGVAVVDWESAAVGAGELDLAFLTWDWGDRITRACELEYQRGRWPAGAPARFAMTLSACRFFMFLRHVADWPDAVAGRGGVTFFRELRATAEELGIC